MSVVTRELTHLGSILTIGEPIRDFSDTLDEKIEYNLEKDDNSSSIAKNIMSYDLKFSAEGTIVGLLKGCLR